MFIQSMIEKTLVSSDTRIDADADDDLFGDFEDVSESRSPFKEHFETVRAEAYQAMQTTDDKGVNVYHGEAILKRLFKMLSTIPIWSDLLSGDLQRFSGAYAAQINQSKKSTAISEATFKNTKVLLLRNEKHRLDECVQHMCLFYKQSAIDFCDKATYRTTQVRCVRPPPVENWNKKRRVPKQLRGSYQQRPSLNSKMFSQNQSSVSVLTEHTYCSQNTGTDTGMCNSICRFANNDNNCWLNATLQSILHLQVVQDILKPLAPSSMVQLSSMPENLAGLIHTCFQNPGHTFDCNTIRGVTQQLVNSIPALALSMHNDPLDFIHRLVVWLNGCGVNTVVFAKHRDTCTTCARTVERNVTMSNIFALPLPQKKESLNCLFEHSIMEGKVQQACTCGSVMKRQIRWNYAPDFITISVSRVTDRGTVRRTPVEPSPVIEIPNCDGTKIKYKLASVICHTGTFAKAGHFWAHLIYDNVVIKANDTLIQIIPAANAVRESKVNGCIFFYVKCGDAAIPIVKDNNRTITEDNLEADDVILCNERPNVNRPMCETMPLPILTFLQQTSAFKKCHTRLEEAATQSTTTLQ